MKDLLSVAGEKSISRYEWRERIAYKKGELCIHGRDVYLNLVEGNIGNHPFYSQTWVGIGRVNEPDLDNEVWEGDYLTATVQNVTDYITCMTKDGLKYIKCIIL
jgi:hypothetical protein